MKPSRISDINDATDHKILNSAVTIFAIEIEITIFDQNRKEIESSILLSHSYDFHESNKCSFNGGYQQITPPLLMHIELQHSPSIEQLPSPVATVL